MQNIFLMLKEWFVFTNIAIVKLYFYPSSYVKHSYKFVIAKLVALYLFAYFLYCFFASFPRLPFCNAFSFIIALSVISQEIIASMYPPHPKKIRFIGLRGWYTHTYGICAPFYCISQKIYILEGWGGITLLGVWIHGIMSLFLAFRALNIGEKKIFICIWAHQYHDSGMRITSNIAKVCAIMFA